MNTIKNTNKNILLIDYGKFYWQNFLSVYIKEIIIKKLKKIRQCIIYINNFINGITLIIKFIHK
jgi:hypothetical protein